MQVQCAPARDARATESSGRRDGKRCGQTATGLAAAAGWTGRGRGKDGGQVGGAAAGCRPEGRGNTGRTGERRRAGPAAASGGARRGACPGDAPVTGRPPAAGEPAGASPAGSAGTAPGSDPGWLLTPGPLTTAAPVRAAMGRDWGSRDADFQRLTREVTDRLLQLSGDPESLACVPVQGSGTYAVEAILGTLAPGDRETLVLVNGAYGDRMVRILDRIGRPHRVITCPDDRPIEPATVAAAVAGIPAISHVAMVHLETSSGLLNPIRTVADIVQRAGRQLLVDAMSSFGALPTGTGDFPWTALAASSNKCLEGVPGIGFVLARPADLTASAGRCHSLSLDLHDQWQHLRRTGQWRFTPPTHVVAALAEALRRHAAEGGVEGRGRRYAENCAILVQGMAKLGFAPLLPAEWRSFVIATFHLPADPEFSFSQFYNGLKQRGFTIYPGKLTAADSFRVGCIGDIDATVMRRFVAAAGDVLREMGDPDPRP